MDSLLKYTGSLLNDGQYITAPYDVSKEKPSGRLEILKEKCVLNQSINEFSIDYTSVKRLNVINGMGVTLGDSIIGIAVLHVIKKINPKIHITVIRPASALPYVEEIYKLATPIIDNIVYMPLDISLLTKDALNIDVGNQLFWPDFHTVEMHDFFCNNLGVEINGNYNNLLSNSWMNIISLDKFQFNDYVLFAPYASTKIRCIPEAFHAHVVDILHQRTGKKILGFADVKHPSYMNVRGLSRSTIDFITIIKNADFLYTSDSSALHVAAAFNVPTECVFTTINPELRTKYYPNCKSYYVGNEQISKIQNSEAPDAIRVVHKQFERFYYG